MSSVARFDTWQAADGTNVARFSGGQLETWDGSAWGPAGAPILVDYVVVAGGGGGNNTLGGGGGAGGYLAGTAYSIPVGTHKIVVGAGAPNQAINTLGIGASSQLASIFAIGGGSGGGGNNPMASMGGSGGGANYSNTFYNTIGIYSQGNQGGKSRGDTAPYECGGGGGAGAAGANAVAGAAGNGGNGLASSITGSSVTRAGGGGGGSRDGSVGAGGTGGGGAGANDGTATSGTANTGGGGGGSDGTGGSGGSGVVIFAVPTGTSVSFSGGVTQSSATVSTKDVYTVTATSTDSETVTIG